jgi:tRNA(Arg) A34 adenosine deaminase TadA
MNKHDFFVQEAIAEAKKCTMTKKHGCIIVHRTNIISRGHNSNHRHTFSKFSLHAEVAAINNIPKQVSVDNIVMYVVRIDNNDLHRSNDRIKTKNSKPCVNCMNCITSHKFKFKTVYFSSDENDGG